MRTGIGLVLLLGFVLAGVSLKAHHAVAGIYDLNKEVVLEGKLKKLNFVNPHASIVLSVQDKNKKIVDWTLTTAGTEPWAVGDMIALDVPAERWLEFPAEGARTADE